MFLIRLVELFLDRAFALIPRSLPNQLQIEQARLIAHRGAHNNASQQFENTEQAFEQALALGCWGIEFDVHATSDGVLMVNHDPSLTRLWSINKSIRELTFAELRQHAPLIPTLSEIVDRYGKRLHLFIELKAPFNTEETLAATLASIEAGQDYHLITLTETVLANLSLFPRTAMLLVADYHNVRKFCRLSIQKKYGGVLGHYLLLSNKKAQILQQAGQVVGVGMVNSTYSLYRELQRGMNWIFSDSATTVCPSLDRLKNCLAFPKDSGRLDK